MQERKDDPLVLAVKENNCKEMEILLKDNKKLRADDLWLAFISPEKTTHEVLALLDSYHALPEGLSINTLKFNLYIRGNQNISLKECLGEPGINVNSYPGLPSPMSIFARSGNIDAVKWLMDVGVSERPLYLFGGVSKSHFQGIDLLELPRFKKRITDNLTENTDALKGHKISDKCQIAELFLKSPTEDLDKEIKSECESKYAQYNKFDLLPFFAWTAVTNRADLFDNKHFQILVKNYPEAIAEATKIAAVFNNKEYIEKTITLVDHNDLRTLLSIAAASHNQVLLESIVEMLKKSGVALTEITHQSNERGDPRLGSIGKDEPLFWAIRSDTLDAVSYLINHGFDANGYVDAFMGSTYLHLAIGMKHPAIATFLLEHGAKPNIKDKLDRTPLYIACEKQQWDIAELLITKYQCNLHEANKDGKKPLDFIKDASIKQRLLAKDSKPTQPVKNVEMKVSASASKAPFFAKKPDTGMKMLTLKNGSEVAEPVVITTMMSLEALMNSNPIAFYELVEKARDSRHQMFGNTRQVVEKTALMNGGSIHDTVKDVILSAVSGKDLEMSLGSPVDSKHEGNAKMRKVG